MQTIFKRKGTKVKAGAVKFTVPQTQSALSIIGTNAIYDQDDFRDDNFVYRNNKKHRKWFSYREGWNHFWEPCINELSRIENIYHKLTIRLNKSYEPTNKILEKIEKTKKGTKWIAHAKQNNDWLKYFIYKDWARHSGLSFSFEWLDNKPKKLINYKLGQALNHENFKVKSKWCWYIQLLLNDAIVLFLKKTFQEKTKNIEEMFILNINSRKYVYTVGHNRSGGPQLLKVCWPRDNVNEISV
jgi:hypothetical protein